MLLQAHHRTITSFEIVLLKISGMRGTEEYEMTMNDGMAELSHYVIRYSDGEARRDLERSAVCSEEEALQLLNTCELPAWDGFYGPHPKHVKDGIMFMLDAVVNDSQKIHAEGSENFPNHYRVLTDGFYHLLAQKENEN